VRSTGLVRSGGLVGLVSGSCLVVLGGLVVFGGLWSLFWGGVSLFRGIHLFLVLSVGF